jgi:hypothetical protein
MAAFYFNYDGQSYHAQADITLNNGQVNCDLNAIVNSLSLEPAKLIGFKPGPVSQNDLPLMKAINKGLAEYIKNYPLDRRQTNG